MSYEQHRGGNQNNNFQAPEPVDRNIKKPWNEVRYKDMDPKAKAELRKQERDFKKDRDRTMGYFNSVNKAISDVGAALQDGSMDQQSAAEAFHAIADGFLTEFQKKLKTDVTIFRNSSACRVMEMVCTKADLTQTKTFMYILLGKVGDLMHSPTASFVFETILAALYRNLGLVLGNETGKDDMLGEMQAADGSAAGHGLPPTQDLLSSWIEEACECMESLIMDIPGSRSLRSLLTMLSGRPIRGVQQPANPPQFPDLLATVADSAMAAIESVYTGAAEQRQLAEANGEEVDNQYRKAPKGTVSASEAWYNACCASTTGAVVQALLRVDQEDILATKLGRLYLRGSSVMHLLLDNMVGSRVVQSFLRNNLSGGAAADAELDAAATARWEQVLNMVLSHPKLDEVIATPGAAIERLSTDHPESSTASAVAEEEAGEYVASYDDEANEEEQGLTSSSHHGNHQSGQKRGRETEGEEDPRGGYKKGGARTDRKNHPNRGTNSADDNSSNSGLNPSVSPLFFLILDLITFCPDEEHLKLLWDDLLSPKLNALVSTPDFGAILTRFTRKCAYHGLNALNEEANEAAATPSNHIQQGQLEEPNVRADILNGAVYFVVQPNFKESIVNEICRALKQRCTKGAAQALLVEKILGDTHSAAIAYNLLHIGTKPCAHFFNAVDKLKADDLVAAAGTAAGSCVFQRFIVTAAARDALAGTATGHNNAAAPKPVPTPTGSKKPATQPTSSSTAPTEASATSVPVKKDTGSLIRFIRRITPYLPTLVASKYAGFVVECAYEHSSIEGKEEIAKNLAEFYQSLVNEDDTVRNERYQGSVGFGAVHSLDPVSRNIAKKVMVKCCVEQYVHRRADWLKLAERQSNVKRMMMQILANDTL